MYEKSFQTDFASEALKGVPPVVVSAATAADAIPVDWQALALMLTVAYLIMQMVWLGWKFIQKAQGKYHDEDRDG